MRRVLSFVVVCVVAQTLASCGPGDLSQQFVRRERHALVVLVERGGSCHARAPRRFNAYEGDTVVWEIVNECGTAKRVDVVFTAQTPVTWIGNAYVNVDPGVDTKEIRATVNANTKGHAYPYNVKVDGASGADPDLEIDPYI